MTVACRISSRLKWYKNCKNRLILANVIVKNKMSRFLWFTVYNQTHVQQYRHYLKQLARQIIGKKLLLLFIVSSQLLFLVLQFLDFLQKSVADELFLLLSHQLLQITAIMDANSTWKHQTPTANMHVTTRHLDHCFAHDCLGSTSPKWSSLRWVRRTTLTQSINCSWLPLLKRTWTRFLVGLPTLHCVIA